MSISTIPERRERERERDGQNRGEKMSVCVCVRERECVREDIIRERNNFREHER